MAEEDYSSDDFDYENAFESPSKRVKFPELSASVANIPSLFVQLKQLLDAIPNNHPMFGPIIKGKLVAPRSCSRSNGVSWENKLVNICDRIINNPVTIGENRCWMVKDKGLNLYGTKTNTGIHRFLAFLADPTDANWMNFTKVHSNNPFIHRCNRGEKRPDGQEFYCINGIEHGYFGDRNTNEDFKKCTYGCLARCPGHGPDERTCIFTLSNGDIAPCLMVPDHMPRCIHQPQCYIVKKS